MARDDDETPPDPSTFGGRLRIARRAASLKANELDREVLAIRKARGEDVETMTGYTSRIESGDKGAPNHEIIGIYAEVLKVRAAWLLFAEEPMRPKGPTIPQRLRDIGATVAGSTEKDLEMVASIRQLGGVADSDELLRDFIAEAVGFRKSVEDKAELELLRRARRGPSPEEQEAAEEAERAAIKKKRSKR